jgi:hypothetical protein
MPGRGLQAEAAEGVGDVVGGLVQALGADAAALELVGGEVLDRPSDLNLEAVLDLDGGRGGPQRLRRRGRIAGQRDGQ